MNVHKSTSKTLHIILWVVQLLIGATLIWAAAMKWFQPADKLAAMWPWTGQISRTLVLLTGLADLLGGTGLILPALIRIQPKWTIIAAIGVFCLMICASIFHISRGEGSQIGFNIFFGLLAGFVAWGRLRKAPIIPR